MTNTETVFRAVRKELARRQADLDSKELLRGVTITVKLDRLRLERAVEFSTTEHRETGRRVTIA